MSIAPDLTIATEASQARQAEAFAIIDQLNAAAAVRIWDALHQKRATRQSPLQPSTRTTA